MTPEEAVAVVERQLAAARLAWAEAMIAAGRDAEAEAALARLDASPTALDLRARIALRRGARDEAARLWGAALDGDPAHAGALAGLALLKRHPRVRRKPALLLTGALAAALLALAAGCGLGGFLPQVFQWIDGMLSPPRAPST